MTLKARKAIKAKIVHPTKVKQRLLDEEYTNLQRLLHGEDASLYSANEQQAKRFYKRKNNRKIHTMASYKTKRMLNYKALWQEIAVVSLNEAYTSQLCWRCKSLNTKIRKRSFRCEDCGLEYNRDLNGAINIGNRLLGYMLKSRAVPQSVAALEKEVNQPKTSPVFTAPKGDLLAIQRAREEAPCES